MFKKSLIIIKCLGCNKNFKIFPYQLKRGKRYCSKKCFNKINYPHRTIDPRGYILIFMPLHPFAKGKGYVYEHRLIIEKQLGRFLTSQEHIHHKDRNPMNNRIENLLLTDNHNHPVLHRDQPNKGRFTTERMLKYWQKYKQSKIKLPKETRQYWLKYQKLAGGK